MGWVLPGLWWQLLASSCLVRCSCGGGGEDLPLPADVKARSEWRVQNRMRAAPTGSHVKVWQQHALGTKGWAGGT